MASALLASRNEPYWGERKVYMRKTPNSNPNPKIVRNPNPNSNPNTNLHVSDRQSQFHAMESDEPHASAAAAVSGDSSSYNRKSMNLNHRRDSTGYITFNISTYSRRELRELKRRLISELDQVRSVTSRIESRDLQSSTRSVGYSTSGIYCGGREVTSSAAVPLVAGSDGLMDRRTLKTDNYFQPAGLPKASDKKRPAAAEAAAVESKRLLSSMMKKCSQILTKLMKHKGGIWFNTPVDVVGMGLHDYHQIIKQPMDLGTVKSKLNKGLYPSPVEFASEIRLTFKNALLYNPEGHDVHKLADQLLRHFEGLFGPAYDRYEKQQAAIAREEEEDEEEVPRFLEPPRVSSWSRVAPMPESATKAVEVTPMIPPPVRTPAQSLPPVQSKPPPQPQPQPQPQQHQHQQQPVVMARTMMTTTSGKQPKPKAKDPNKRAMSLEEKQKLSSSLQSLPQEKTLQVLQIVRKRNIETSQDGDEVELDFELMDTETLWELDRFVCNWKKMMSKIRRQEAMAGHNLHSSAPPSAVAPPASPPVAESGGKSPMEGETLEALAAKKSKKGDPCDEDVDIGDEMPSTNYPSVEIEKETGYGSSSSSSGSDSSSSSDSDSGSSSGSDSDEEDARSPPAGGSRPSPRN